MSISCALNGLSSLPLFAAVGSAERIAIIPHFQEHVTGFVRHHLGPELNVVATLQTPHEFLRRIARENEPPIQAMFRFHKSYVYGRVDFTAPPRSRDAVPMTPLPPAIAEIMGKPLTMKPEQLIEAYFAAVVEVMTEGMQLFQREQTRQAVFAQLLDTVTVVAKLKLAKQEQLTLDSKELTFEVGTWGPTHLVFLRTLRNTNLLQILNRMHVDRDMYLGMTMALERHYRTDLPDMHETWDGGTLEDYVDAIIEELQRSRT